MEDKMRYMMMYKPDSDAPPTNEHLAKMGKFIQDMMEAGVLISTEGLLPMSRGARVRLSNNKVVVTDGPFVETKEVVGGLAIIEASSKAQAIENAKLFLDIAGDGECEIRELMPRPDVGSPKTNR